MTYLEKKDTQSNEKHHGAMMFAAIY